MAKENEMEMFSPEEMQSPFEAIKDSKGLGVIWKICQKRFSANEVGCRGKRPCGTIHHIIRL